MFVGKVLCIILFMFVFSQIFYSGASASIQHIHTTFIPSSAPGIAPPPSDIRLDSRLPAQSFSTYAGFNNINAKFGSRFNFTISPGTASVHSGTDGVFHDNEASYIVGVAPANQQKTYIFHMGSLNSAQKDSYVSNE